MQELTTREAAAELGVTQRRIVQMIQEGKLKAKKKGRDYFIELSELEYYKEYELERKDQK